MRQRCLLFFLMFLCASTSAFAVELVTLESCPQELKTTPVYTALNANRNRFASWSHIDVDDKEFSQLKGSNIDYSVSPSTYLDNPRCSGMQTLNVNLVAKLSDWERQHANGLELKATGPYLKTDTDIESSPLTFGEFDALIIDLSVIRQQTRIKTQQDLVEFYGDLLTPTQLMDLDNGKASLQITLFAAGANNQNTRSLNASLIVDIDHKALADQWLRLIIERSEFEYFYEQQYQKSVVNAADVLDVAVAGIRITAETSSGKQLRNVLGEHWNTQIPEAFKDIALQVSQVALTKER